MTLSLSSKSSRVKKPKDSTDSLPADKSNIKLFRLCSLGKSLVNDRKALVAINVVPDENQLSDTHQNENRKDKIRKTIRSTKELFKNSRWLTSEETCTKVKVEKDSNLNQERVSIFLSDTHSITEENPRESLQENSQEILSSSSIVLSALSASQSQFCELSPSVFRLPIHLRNILLVRSILRYLLSRIIIRRRSNALKLFEEESSEVAEAEQTSITTPQRKKNPSHQSGLIRLLRRIKSLTKLLTRITKKLRMVAKDLSPRQSYHTDADDELNSQNDISEPNTSARKPRIKGVMLPLEYRELSYINGSSESENDSVGEEILGESRELFDKRLFPLQEGRFIEEVSGDGSSYDSSEDSSREDSIENHQLRVVHNYQNDRWGDSSLKVKLELGFQTSLNTLDKINPIRSRLTSQIGVGDIQIPAARTSMCAEVQSEDEFEFNSEAYERDSVLSAQNEHQLVGLEFDNFGDYTSYIAYLEFAATEEAANNEAENKQAEESSFLKSKFGLDNNNVESQELLDEDQSEKDVECNFRSQTYEDLPELTAIRKVISEDLVSLFDSAGISVSEMESSNYTGSIPLRTLAANPYEDIESTGIAEFDPSSISLGTLEAIVEEEDEEIFGEQIMTLDALFVNLGDGSVQEYYHSPSINANFNPPSNLVCPLETIEEALEMSPGFSINLAIFDRSALESAMLDSAAAIIACKSPAQFGEKTVISSLSKDIPFMHLSKIANHRCSPCTKTSKKWGDYADSDSDDSIFEQFFASHGKLCPPKPFSIKPELFPSTTHSSRTASGSGSGRKFDCGSADLTSPNSIGSLILLLEKSKNSSDQNRGRKPSLEELFDSTSCNAKDIEFSDSKGNQDEVIKKPNSEGSLTWVEIELLLLVLNAENDKRKEILSCNTKEVEEHKYTLPESDYSSKRDLQMDSFPMANIPGNEIELPDFKTFSDLASEWKALRDCGEDNSHSQDHIILKELSENYRRNISHLIKYVVLPCNFQIRVLIEKILQARRKEKELVSLETGATNEITTILQEFEKNTELTSTFWEKKLDSIGSTVNKIDILYNENEGTLGTLENKFPQEITLVIGLIRYIQNMRNEVLTAFYQIVEQLELQNQFQNQDIQHFTFANYFQKRTAWYSQLDLEEFQSILTDNLKSLVASMELVQQRMILIHENLSSAKRTIITGSTKMQKSQSENNVNENNVAGDKCIEHSETRIGRRSGKKGTKAKKKNRSKDKKFKAKKKIKNKR